MPPRPRPGPQRGAPAAPPSGAWHAGAAPPETIGALLTRLRQSRGYTQLRLAELLCGASSTPTVSRHEVSRWEREERMPGRFWLGWLATVLDCPLTTLESAAAVTRRRAEGEPTPGSGPNRLWRPPSGADLLVDLGHATGDEIRELAYAWLVGRADREPAPAGELGPAGGAGQPARVADKPPPYPLESLPVWLGRWRRTDDLVGGADTAALVAAELKAALAALPAAGTGRRRRDTLRLVASLAQLAGWTLADAGDPGAARRAYQVALRAAAAGADRPLAAHVLGALSHLSLDRAEAAEALLLARTGHAGARRIASPLTRALLLHRVALAAAGGGQRRTAHGALAAAARIAQRARPGAEPAWLYWLDGTELAAMTGRCLAALGRPLRAEPLLSPAVCGARGPRAAAIYGCWLARVYLDVGEVEQACAVAAEALVAAARAGSARATAELWRLERKLVRLHDVAAVRGYRRLAAAAVRYLPPAPSHRGGYLTGTGNG